MDESLLSLLACPRDKSPLTRSSAGDAMGCPACGRSYPIEDGIVRCVPDDDLTELDRREQSSRDGEADWYDSVFEGYTNAVEIPAVIDRVASLAGPVGAGPLLDSGSGTGRFTEPLLDLGRPVIAVDYSFDSLRVLEKRCAGRPVLAVQGDVRALPFVTDAIGSICCAGLLTQIRGVDNRRAVLTEMVRVLRPRGGAVVEALNFTWVFRAWKLRGNQGAKEGDHLMTGNYYYLRMTQREFRSELEAVFDVDSLTAVRHIPARTIANGLRRASDRLGDRFMDWMTSSGYRLDRALDKVPPVAGYTGFFHIATVTARG